MRRNSLAPFDEDGIREDEKPMPIAEQILHFMCLIVKLVLIMSAFSLACALVSKFIYFIITNN